MDERLKVLQTVPIFGALQPETLGFLCEHLTEVDLDAGEYFFRQGEMGDAVYVLEAGRAEVIRSRKEQAVTLTSLEPGACFGEIALLAICPRSASVRAMERSRAVRLEHKVLFELYGRDLEQFTLLQMNLGREVARRLNDTTDLLLALLQEAADPQPGAIGQLANSLK